MAILILDDPKYGATVNIVNRRVEVWRLRSHSNHVILESCTVSKFEKWNYILFKRKAGFRHKAQESKSCISGSTSALESYVHSIHGLRFHHHF